MKKKISCLSFLTVLLMLLHITAVFAETQSATTQGFGGDVTVTVEVEDGEIVSVKAEGAGETQGVGSVAIDELPAAIVKAQSVAIDGISGATFSSTAVLDAAKEALIAAGMDEETITAVQEKEPVSTEAIELEADVAVIGAGGAGMSAALEAQNHGADVIVLEKMGAIGGNTLVAGSAMNAAQPVKQATQTMPADRIATVDSFLDLEPQHPLMAVWQEEVRDEIEAYKKAKASYLFDSAAFHKLQTYVGGDYVADPELIEVLGNNAIDGVYWLDTLGTTWKDEIVSVYGSTWTSGHNLRHRKIFLAAYASHVII